MLTLDLVRLDRGHGPVPIHEEVPEDTDLFDQTEVPLARPLVVDAKASLLSSGEVVVRGSVSGTLARECRRCLEPVDAEFEQDLDLLFMPADELGGEVEEDEGVRVFDPSQRTLDLGEAIREEVVLSAPLYVVCSDECQGLCPECGINLNEEDCDCVRNEADPRWDALRALKKD